jgi:hypothetical protein
MATNKPTDAFATGTMIARHIAARMIVVNGKPFVLAFWLAANGTHKALCFERIDIPLIGNPIAPDLTLRLISVDTIIAIGRFNFRLVQNALAHSTLTMCSVLVHTLALHFGFSIGKIIVALALLARIGKTIGGIAILVEFAVRLVSVTFFAELHKYIVA